MEHNEIKELFDQKDGWTWRKKKIKFEWLFPSLTKTLR